MRKRSSYKPKPVNHDALNWVLQGLKRMPELKDANMILRTKNHIALELALKGQATKDDLDVLIAAVNMTEALCRLKLGNDWSSEIKAGQEALLQMCRRGLEVNRFVFTGPEMQAVKLSISIHDAQLDQCTVADMEKALLIVQREIKQKRARVIEEVTA